MRRGSLLVTLVCVASCGSGAPVNVAGEYSVGVTNHENGCGLANWTEGSTSTNIPLTVTQDGSHVTAIIEGLVGAYVNTLLGSKSFVGTVDGNHLVMTLYGTRSYTQANCTYTINGTADAMLTGDVLQGNITYTAATNNSPDCGALQACASVQAFNGARPPP